MGQLGEGVVAARAGWWRWLLGTGPGQRQRCRGVVVQALERGEVAAGGARERGNVEIMPGCPGFHFLYRNFTIIPLV
jgi:hypothetical protein